MHTRLATLLLLFCLAAATIDTTDTTAAPAPVPTTPSPTKIRSDLATAQSLAGVPVDLDGDGNPDRWTEKPVQVDTTGDGKADSEAVDTTGNGQPDTVVLVSKEEKMLVAKTPVTNPDVPTPSPEQLTPTSTSHQPVSTHRDGQLVIPLGANEEADEVTITADDDDSEQPIMHQVPMDTNGDGITDSLVDAAEVDLSGDGNADALAIDTTGDGHPDTLVIPEMRDNTTVYVRGAQDGDYPQLVAAFRASLDGHTPGRHHSRHGVGVGLSITGVVLFGLVVYLGRRSETAINPSNWQCCKCQQQATIGPGRHVRNPINGIEMTGVISSGVMVRKPKPDKTPLTPASSDAVAQQWAIMDGTTASL